MNTTQSNIISLLFIAIVVATAAWLYPSLPEQIPTHWNIHGEVDDYTAKPWGVWLLPLAALFTFGLMKVIPVISPKGYRTESFSDVYNIFTVTLVGFMSGVGLLVLLEASGRDMRFNEMMYAGLGLLFIVMGNFLGKVRKNFFLGIRTPWTLVSDEVWSRTHRLGGRVFVIIGILMFLGAFVQIPTAALTALIVVGAFIPVIYSYVLYRRLEGFESDESAES